MNLGKQIATHPWTPRVVALLFVLALTMRAIAGVAVVQSAAQSGQQLEACRQERQSPALSADLRLEVPTTIIATDEAGGPWPCGIPGDLDCDCDVDIVDIMLVVRHWGGECR